MDAILEFVYHYYHLLLRCSGTLYHDAARGQKKHAQKEVKKITKKPGKNN